MLFVRFDLRMHRKIIVIDGETASGAPQGEYLRSFGAEIIPVEGGSPTVESEVTNSSLVETAAIHFSSTVQGAWISLRNPEAEVHPGIHEGTHAVGTAILDKTGL
jgi:phosphatidylserine/phosphatidylglycerophosphate/cardiolipin synthase-like enzyme